MTIQLPHQSSAACTLSPYPERVDAGLWCIQGSEVEHLGCAAHRCFVRQAHLPYTATISRGLALYFIPQPCVRKPQTYHSSSISMSPLLRLSAQAKPFQHRTALLPTGEDRNRRYIYGALETPTTIRVLRLEPGFGNEPLRGEILHTDLIKDDAGNRLNEPLAHETVLDPNETYCAFDDRNGQEERKHADWDARTWAPYEALSYVWGQAILSHRLSTSRGTIRITQSLAAALQHLRHKHKFRIIWADGICINQDDSKERGHQVKMMDRVYSGAEGVLIWLGTDPGNEAEEVFSKLTDYVTFGSRWDNFSNEQPAAIAMTNRILKSEWFSRVWVVQEFVLARNVLFLWGNAQLANWIITRLVNDLDTNLVDTWLTHFSGPVHGHFLQTLRHARKLLCANACDRIYGLIGIRFASSPLSNAVAKLHPDYSQPVEHLYSDFACLCVENNEILHILSEANHPLETSTCLPSWVPDWRRPNVCEHFQYVHMGKPHILPHGMKVMVDRSTRTLSWVLRSTTFAQPCIRNLILDQCQST